MRSPARHRITISAAQPAAVRVVASGAHDGDDLLHLRRIGRIAKALVARRSTGVKAGHCRRRSTSTSAIEQRLGHDPSSGSSLQAARIDRVGWRASFRRVAAGLPLESRAATTPRPGSSPCASKEQRGCASFGSAPRYRDSSNSALPQRSPRLLLLPLRSSDGFSRDSSKDDRRQSRDHRSALAAPYPGDGECSRGIRSTAPCFGRTRG